MKARRNVVLSFFAFCAAFAFGAGIDLKSPADGTTVPLVSDAQKAFLFKSPAERASCLSDQAKRAELHKAGYLPLKVRFAWACIEPGHDDLTYMVKVTRKADGKEVFCHSTHTLEEEIDNLEIATSYSWRVEAKTKDGRRLSGKGEFATEDCAPRFIRLENVPNIRDFGGRRGLGGRRVRQGLVYRSAGFNGNACKHYTEQEVLAMYRDGTLLSAVPEKSRKFAREIKARLDKGEKIDYECTHLPKEWIPGKTRLNQESIEYAKRMFGIRTDLDLRSERECYGMTGSPLGPHVRWINISSSAYSGLRTEKGKKAFAAAFRVFLDEENYPIGFHCIAGADRTGSLAYVLGALLGVSDDDLLKDWETTAFHNKSPTFTVEKRFAGLFKVFTALPGANTCAKAEAFVKSVGYSDADIAKFRAIMLEP